MNRATLLGSALLAVFAAVLAAGCGGGSGSGGSTSPPPPPQQEVIRITSNTSILCVKTQAFSVTLQETGAVTAVSWSLADGALPDGLALNGTTGTISGTPSNTAINSTASIRASDSKVSSQPIPFFFQVLDKLVLTPSSFPNAHLNAPYAQSIVGEPFSNITSWTIIAGQLPPGLTLNGVGGFNPTAASISGTPTQAGTFSFTVQAVDNSVPQTATLSTSIVVDTHLTITKSTLRNGEQTLPYSDTFTAVNGTPPLTWSLNSPLPQGLSLNATTGQVTGTPTQPVSYPYTVTVTDSSPAPQTDSAQGTTTIAPPLQISTTLDPTFINQPFFASFFASGGFPPYTWTLVSGSVPPGLNLQSAGFLSGTPTQLGSYPFVLQVADSALPPFTATQSFTLNVTPTPVSLFAPLSPAPVNVSYHSQIAVYGGTPPYSFSITSGALPAGIAIDSSSGHLDGTPTQFGTFSFTVSVRDSSPTQQTAVAVDIIQIRKSIGRNDSIATATPLGNTAIQPITFLSISPYADPVDSTTPSPDTDYFRLLATTGNIVHVETISQRSGFFGTTDSLDSVLELLDQNGNRLQNCGSPSFSSPCLNDDIDSTTTDSALDFKVPAAPGNQLTFFAHVLDWRGDARPDMQYYLNISGVNEPLSITSILGNGATRGFNFQQPLSTAGGSGTVTWSLASGTLPNGWNLSSSGTLGGIALTSGNYAFTIQAQDSSNPPQTAQKPFTLLIADPVSITSAPVLPNACVNKPYSFALTTSGGVPPLQFDLGPFNWTSIVLNQSTGIFGGTPSTPGTYTANLVVLDSATPLTSASQPITLTVVNCP